MGGGGELVVGRVHSGGGMAARGGLYPLLGLFGVAMSPKSTVHRPRYVYRA